MSTAVLLSVEEFLARPERDDWQREELIEGEVIVSPGVIIPHAEIVRRLRLLLAPLEQLEYMVANDFACLLPEHSVLNPDLAAVRRERWNDALKRAIWLPGSPELVVEVSSPSNRKLYQKAALYVEHGAEQVWVIYPKTHSVTIYTTEGTTEARLGETLEFHGVTAPVAELFPS